MTNNAVFPHNQISGQNMVEADHFHTKHKPSVYLPDLSPMIRESPQSRNKSDYVSVGQLYADGFIPEFQMKKVVRKKSLALAWEVGPQNLENVSLQVNDVFTKERNKKLFPQSYGMDLGKHALENQIRNAVNEQMQNQR